MCSPLNLRQTFVVSASLVMSALLGSAVLTSCTKAQHEARTPVAPVALPSAAVQTKTSPAKRGPVPDKLIVVFRTGAISGQSVNSLMSGDYRILSVARHLIPTNRWATITVQPNAANAVTQELLKRPNVASVSHDYYIHGLGVCDSQVAGTPWQMEMIQLPAALQKYALIRPLPKTPVAVLDTGVQLDNVNLAPSIARKANGAVLGASEIKGVPTPNDDNGHGTFVAGIIASIDDPRHHIKGIDPAASIIPVKVLDSSESGTLSGLADGINFAVSNGAKVINMSLGCARTDCDPGVSVAAGALANARRNGVLLVAASGNDYSDTELEFPASDSNVVAVGATDEYDERADYSNGGRNLALVAPGTSVYSTFLGSQFCTGTGTSFAAPIVSGIAALLVDRASTPANTLGQIERGAVRIGDTSQYDTAGHSNIYGYGRVSAIGAVNAYAPASRP